MRVNILIATNLCNDTDCREAPACRRKSASVSGCRKTQEQTFDKVTYFSNLFGQGIISCSPYTLALIFVRHTSGIYGAVGPISSGFKGRNSLTNLVAVIFGQIWCYHIHIYIILRSRFGLKRKASRSINIASGVHSNAFQTPTTPS